MIDLEKIRNGIVGNYAEFPTNEEIWKLTDEVERLRKIEALALGLAGVYLYDNDTWAVCAFCNAGAEAGTPIVHADGCVWAQLQGSEGS